MLKKTLYVLAVLLVPALVLAADETIDSDTFQAIKSLADAKVVTIQIYKDKLTRQEAVTYINNAVTNLLGDTTGDLATNENINKVFDLVKEFQTDMMESGQKLSAIEQTLIDLKLKEEQN